MAITTFEYYDGMSPYYQLSMSVEQLETVVERCTKLKELNLIDCCRYDDYNFFYVGIEEEDILSVVQGRNIKINFWLEGGELILKKAVEAS